MLILKKILFILEKFFGEGNVIFIKPGSSGFVIVYCNGNKVMYLVKSYCGGWVCLLNFALRFYDVKPFLIKSNNIDKFEDFIKNIDLLSNNYLSKSRRIA